MKTRCSIESESCKQLSKSIFPADITLKINIFHLLHVCRGIQNEAHAPFATNCTRRSRLERYLRGFPCRESKIIRRRIKFSSRLFRYL